MLEIGDGTNTCITIGQPGIKNTSEKMIKVKVQSTFFATLWCYTIVIESLIAPY